MATVASTLGSSTSTFWKRRSSRPSHHLRYSSTSWRSAIQFAARWREWLCVGVDGTGTIVQPSVNSTMRLYQPPLSRGGRSSNSPRYSGPAMSSDSTRVAQRRHLAVDNALRQALGGAVLPTPGCAAGCSWCVVAARIARRISSSRPITGSGALALGRWRVILQRLAPTAQPSLSAFSRAHRIDRSRVDQVAHRARRDRSCCQPAPTALLALMRPIAALAGVISAMQQRHQIAPGCPGASTALCGGAAAVSIRWLRRRVSACAVERRLDRRR
jgi:hypothetical protein